VAKESESLWNDMDEDEMENLVSDLASDLSDIKNRAEMRATEQTAKELRKLFVQKKKYMKITTEEFCKAVQQWREDESDAYGDSGLTDDDDDIATEPETICNDCEFDPFCSLLRDQE
jgi:hypothetical protein